MTSDRWAMIDKNTNIVVNVIVWDGVTPMNFRREFHLLQTDEGDIDDKWDPVTQTLTKPTERSHK